MTATASAVDWLHDSDEPGIVFQTGVICSALVVLARMGLAGDPRAADGVHLGEERRRARTSRWSTGARDQASR